MGKVNVDQHDGTGDVHEGIGAPLNADVITQPLSEKREEFPNAKARGAKAAAKDALSKINVEQEAKFLDSAAEMLLGPGEDAPPRQPVTVETADGFQNPVAQEVFQVTGNRNKAKLADQVVKLLGGSSHLYEQVKHFARNAGQNNEAFWLGQHLGEMVAKEEVELVTQEDIDLYGGNDKRLQEDDNAASHYNVQLSELLGKRTLSAVRSRAKELGVSNKRFLQALVHVSLNQARRKGLAGHYEAAPAPQKPLTEGNLLATVFEALGKLGFTLQPPTKEA